MGLGLRIASVFKAFSVVPFLLLWKGQNTEKFSNFSSINKRAEREKISASSVDLMKEAEEAATELTLIENTDDCYYWIVKLVIKLAVLVFLQKTPEILIFCNRK